MSQLHCHVQDERAKKFQKKAEQANLSVSKYLALLVQREVENQWSGGYFELFGAWQGEPLERSPQAELLYGARHSQRVEANLQLLKQFFYPLASLPFDDRCAEEARQIRADLATQGNPIGPDDSLIAATARAHDSVLITHNTGEYSRITGLRMEDGEVG